MRDVAGLPHLGLVRMGRLPLPACDDFDQQVILAQCESSRGRCHPTGSPMEVMNRDGRKRPRE
ncbi:MAG: hypothetical protein ACLQUY_22160 [Ktedonobacterales bacterium]